MRAYNHRVLGNRRNSFRGLVCKCVENEVKSGMAIKGKEKQIALQRYYRIVPELLMNLKTPGLEITF